MIVPDQKNLKVHYAGTEQFQHLASLKATDVRYCLFTVFPFIAKQFKLKGASSVAPKMAVEIDKFSKHSIMDSGLFTLMFGAHAGHYDKEFITRWYEAIIEFVATSGYAGTCVEVDCQKVLGVDEAWKLRERMRDELPNRQINVFHWEDGKKGLDRLIEFSDYIAISVPELRALGKKSYTYNLAHYIKNKKPEIDIHLLGCTERKLLSQLKFCSTSDSTSWLSCVIYGQVELRGGEKRHMDSLKDEAVDKYRDKIIEFYDEHDVECRKNQNTVKRNSILAYQANEFLARYTKCCGDQT